MLCSRQAGGAGLLQHGGCAPYSSGKTHRGVAAADVYPSVSGGVSTNTIPASTATTPSSPCCCCSSPAMRRGHLGACRCPNTSSSILAADCRLHSRTHSSPGQQRSSRRRAQICRSAAGVALQPSGGDGGDADGGECAGTDSKACCKCACRREMKEHASQLWQPRRTGSK